MAFRGMKNLTIDSITKVTGGDLYMPELMAGAEGAKVALDDEVRGVAADIRFVDHGYVYIAVRNESVDGNEYIQTAFEKKACLAICEELPDEFYGPCLLVKDCMEALDKIAAFYRQQVDIKVIGVTGSVGKSATKEMIAGVLMEKYRVHYIQESLYGKQSIALTLLKIKDEHEVAVIKMGVEAPGKMKALAEMVNPDIAVITSIGLCHLDNFNDRNGVFKAKTEIFNGLKEGGRAVLNGDDDKLREIQDVNGTKPVFYGVNDGSLPYHVNRIRDHRLMGSEFTLCGDGIGDTDVELKIPGYHMISNAVAAAAVGRVMGLSETDIKRGLEKCHALRGRNEIIYRSRMTIIDGSTNSNVTSAKAAIDLLMKGEGIKIAILGDITSLGADTAKYHSELGMYAAKQGADKIICVGEMAEAVSRGAKNGGMAESKIFCYPDADKAADHVLDYAVKDSTVLLKASKSVNLEKVLEALKEEF